MLKADAWRLVDRRITPVGLHSAQAPFLWWVSIFCFRGARSLWSALSHLGAL